MSTPWIVVVVCLWLVVLGLVVVVAGVLRKVAAALESQAATGLPAGRRIGPVNGDPLPQITVGEANGRTILLSEVPGPFVLAILTSHCAPCLSIAEWLRANPERLRGAGRLVVLTDAEGRAAIDLDSCATVLTDDADAAFQALDAPGTPFVLAVDTQGKVTSSSLLSGPEQLLRMLDVPASSLDGAVQIQVVG